MNKIFKWLLLWCQHLLIFTGLVGGILLLFVIATPFNSIFELLIRPVQNEVLRIPNQSKSYDVVLAKAKLQDEHNSVLDFVYIVNHNESIQTFDRPVLKMGLDPYIEKMKWKDEKTVILYAHTTNQIDVFRANWEGKIAVELVTIHKTS